MTLPNYNAWRFWFDVVQLAGTVIIGAYVWWSNRVKVTAKRFEALEREVNLRASALTVRDAKKEQGARCAIHLARTAAAESAIVRIDSDMKHMPTAGDISALSSQIGQFQKDLGELSGKLSGINRAVDLINEFLINQGARQ